MKEKMKKIIKLLLAFVVIILAFNIITHKSTSEKVEKYITTKGFTHTNDSKLYYKQISKLNLAEYNKNVANNKEAVYENLCLDAKNYNLTMTRKEYLSNIETDFTPKYDYIKEVITYSYKIIIKDVSLIYEGEYVKDYDNFTCENIYSSGIDVSDSNSTYCEKIKYDLENFYYTLIDIIDNPTLLEKMKAENTKK